MIDNRLWRLSGMTRLMTVLALLTVGQAFVILGQGHFLAQAIVHAWKRQPIDGLWPLAAAFFACFVLRQVITWGRNTIAANAADAQTDQMRHQLLARTFDLGPQHVAHLGTGNVVTMALDGMPEVHQYLELITNKLLDMAIIPWVLVAYIFMQHHLAGFVLFLLFPVIIFFMVILGTAAKEKSAAQYAGFTQMANHFTDALRGLKTLQLMGVAKQYADNVYRVSEGYRKQTMAVLKIAMLSSFALDFFATLSIAVVAVFLGIDLLNGAVTLYPAMVALILAPEYFMPIRQFGNDYHATLNGKNAFAAVQEVLATPIAEHTEDVPAFTWQADSTLVARNLSQHYGQSRGVAGVNLNLTGFAKVAIIGASGAGKSTLLNLIGGFLQPDAGQFEVAGVKVPHLTQSNWQQHLSYIPQTPYIFADSIEANLRFYRPEASAAELSAAVAQAGLSQWVATLPEGLATRIGEGGRGISGGQAQRIALARTLLDTKRSVWLFDEPTAHLDIETEAKLKQTILPLLDHKLAIFATHRLHWLNQMDWVIVLDHGVVVAQGAPSDLAAHSLPYQELIKQMQGGFDDEMA